MLSSLDQIKSVSNRVQRRQVNRIHASRLLNEVHGNKKRNFYILVDLQKAYDSVDREILWEILEKRCKNDGEKAMVKLMMKLHRESTIQVGEHEINAEMGLP